MNDYISACITDMCHNNLIVSANRFVVDDNFHRVPDKAAPSKQDGWYIAHYFEKPNGGRELICNYGSWRRGTKHTFFSYDKSALNSDERQHIREIQMQQINRVTSEKNNERMCARNQALEKYKTLSEHGESPYLIKKQVRAHVGCRFDGNHFVIPVIDTDAEFCGLKVIYPDGKKKFAYGTQAQGGFYTLGDFKNSGQLFIAEGYATGATIYEITQVPTVIVFSEKNIKTIAIKFRELFPEVEIIIAADNDIETEQKSGVNPGMLSAREAAAHVNGAVVYPRFPEGVSGSDFNDLCVNLGDKGISAVRHCLSQKHLPGAMPCHQSEPGHARDTHLQVFEQRYQTILKTFSQFKIHVSPPVGDIARFSDGPAIVCYRVVPDVGTNVKKLFDQHDLLKLELKLPEFAYIRFFIDAGTVNIEIPKLNGERYFISGKDLWLKYGERESDNLCVPIGIDSKNNIVEINFSDASSPHLLIGGTTGSGKSEALNTILGGMTKFYSSQQLKLLMVDPKGTELLAYEDVPHLLGEIGWDEKDALKILREAVKEMQRRYHLFKKIRTRTLLEYNARVDCQLKLPWWIVVLDEYGDLTSDPGDKKAIEPLLKRLAQKARACGIHLILCTQKPSAEVISTNLRANLPAQLALRVKGVIESRIIMDEPGAEVLTGKGDAFFKCKGVVTRLQCAKI